MKYLFIIQGEGRGHMTQALSLAQMLMAAGHQVTRAIVGKSPRRSLPSFFIDKIGVPVVQLDAPNFVTDKDQKSVKPLKTIVYSLLRSKVYKKSIDTIDKMVKEDDPDVIINFYEFLGGLYNFSRRPKAKMVCIAHQFLMAHPEFDFPNGRLLDRLSLRMGNRVARLGADKILALSFQHFSDMPKKKLFVVPPLIRQEVRDMPTSQDEHFLVYMVNPGYSTDVKRFHDEHPSQPIHCFWDKAGMPKTHVVDETLTFHQLDDQKFIHTMAAAKGYVTTAGFESVCEAMYLGKPVLMVPVQGHYEQACNAIDAQKAGAGIYSDTFDIEKLYEYLPRHQSVAVKFQAWVAQTESQLLKHLTKWP